MAVGLLVGGVAVLGSAAAGMSVLEGKRRMIAEQLTDPAQRAELLHYVGEDAVIRATCLVQYGRITRGLDLERVTATGRTTPHWGLDLGGPRGTPVYAAKTSLCVFAGATGGYGRNIRLGHLDTLESSLYGHLDRLAVREGDIVLGGQLVGLVGNSTRDAQGRAPRGWAASQVDHMPPHLHFEVHPRPVPALGPRIARLDPQAWLRRNEIEPFCERWEG